MKIVSQCVKEGSRDTRCRMQDAGCRMQDAARWYIHLLVNDLLSDKFENFSADQAD